MQVGNGKQLVWPYSLVEVASMFISRFVLLGRSLAGQPQALPQHGSYSVIAQGAKSLGTLVHKPMQPHEVEHTNSS